MSYSSPPPPPPISRRSRRREFHLRPLNLSELLDEALALYRANWRLFLGVVMTPLILSALGAAGLEVYQLRAVTPSGSPEDALKVLAEIGTGMILFMPLLILCWMWEQTALAHAIAARYQNEEVNAGEINRRVRHSIWPVLGAMALLYLAIAGATLVFMFVATLAGTGGESPLILLMVPLFCVGAVALVVFVVLISLMVPSIVVEGLGARAGIMRSLHLVWSQFGRVFGTIIVSGVISTILTWVVQLAISVPFAILGLIPSVLGGEVGSTTGMQVVWSGVSSFLSSFGAGLISPFIMAITVLLYFDIRIRKEGFDIEMLARNMGREPGPSSMPYR